MTTPASPEQVAAWAAKAREAIATSKPPETYRAPEREPRQPVEPLEPSEALALVLDNVRALRAASLALEASLIEALPFLVDREADEGSFPSDREEGREEGRNE